MSSYGNILNPVFYIQSPNIDDAIEELSSIYAETCAEHLTLTNNSQNDKSSLMRITTLGLRKYSLRLLVGLRKPITYYDEREWRIINDDNRGQPNEWKWGLSEAEYKDIKKEINDELFKDLNSYITIYEDNISDAISCIVVKKESQVSMLVDYIMKSKRLFGNEVSSEKVKMNLVSKITSVKRITLDY